MVTDMIAPAIDSFEVETRVLVPFTIGHAMDLMNVKLILSLELFRYMKNYYLPPRKVTKTSQPTRLYLDKNLFILNESIRIVQKCRTVALLLDLSATGGINVN
ncbi:hypothetical protein NPIL_307911 [Nephila pilipes]|uniref:Uncharacterized protein n=1 Tax=Nephila pilipes TaxID=299642 RepID=A0A8X6PFV4_NEPPI|nr:hypothetical protein NPIL_624331 [Nephila pilipes]GFT68699.1 hypothetical protein NPIL_307911 [Nephila pilipes]